MIVPSMTSKDLVREVFSDFEAVRVKADYLIKSLRREVVKSRSKYVHRIFPYKTKKYNNWQIIVDYPYKKPTYIGFVTFYDENEELHGIRVDDGLKSLTHFTPHFLTRYNERFLRLTSTSSLELLVRFIDENFLDAIHYTNTRDKYRREIFCKFKDGDGFGDSEYFPELKKELLHFRTMITDGMLFEDQMDDAIRMNTGIQKYIQEHKIDFRKRA